MSGPPPVRIRPLTDLFRQPQLLAYLAVRGFTLCGTHMFNVALGWQVYDLTGSVMMLGVVGAIRFVPATALFPLTGYAADRFPRLVVYRVAMALQVLAVLIFAANALSPAPGVGAILLALVPFGVARAFINTASRSVLPNIVPQRFLQNAVAYNSTVSKVATVLGPVLAGLVMGVSVAAAYCGVALCFALALAGLARIRPIAAAAEGRGSLGASLVAGLHFLRGRPDLLGLITLDFVVVVAGTVLGILPVFAKDVLGTGPEGLGLLRAMPPLGSMLAALLLSQVRPVRAAGPVLFGALGVYGLAIVAFGLSTSLPLSLAMLLVYGATDTVCVILRQVLVQSATPNEMRGRVTAIETAGSNGSEELGNFRAGAVAAVIGAQAAVVLGGAMTIGLAALWALRSPALRRMRGPADGD